MKGLSGVIVVACLASAGCSGHAKPPAVAKGTHRAPHRAGRAAPTADTVPFFSADDASATTRPTEHSYFPQQSLGRQISQTIPLDIMSLPMGDLPEGVTQNTPTGSWPVEIPASTPTPDGVELRPRTDPNYGYDYGSPYRPVAIHFKNFVLADLHMAGAQWPGGGELGDALIYCSLQPGVDGSSSYYGYRIAPVHFEGLERKGDDLQYTVIDGWVDSQTCKLRFDHEASARVGEIIPGLLYGYLSCVRPAPVTQGNSVPTVVDPYSDSRPACTDPNRVNLLFPKSSAMASTAGPGANQALVTLSRASLPLRQGVGEAVTASIDLDEMKKWASALGLPGDMPPPSNRTIEMGVEVQQGSRDEKAQAVVYIASPDPNSDSIRFNRKFRPKAKL